MKMSSSLPVSWRRPSSWTSPSLVTWPRSSSPSYRRSIPSTPLQGENGQQDRATLGSEKRKTGERVTAPEGQKGDVPKFLKNSKKIWMIITLFNTLNLPWAWDHVCHFVALNALEHPFPRTNKNTKVETSGRKFLILTINFWLHTN